MENFGFQLKIRFLLPDQLEESLSKKGGVKTALDGSIEFLGTVTREKNMQMENCRTKVVQRRSSRVPVLTQEV